MVRYRAMDETGLADLFESEGWEHPYPDELIAVSTGRKAMSLWGFPADVQSLSRGADAASYADLLVRVRSLGLVATNVERTLGSRKYVDVFVSSAENTWRVRAYNDLRAAFADGGWNDGAERLQSKILGYEDQETERWIRRCKWNQAVWGSPTLYLVLGRSQIAALAHSAFRSFEPATLAPMTPVMLPLRSSLVLRSTAWKDLIGFHVVRAGVTMELITSALGKPPFRGAVAIGSVGSLERGYVNQRMRSRIEVLTESGWVSEVPPA